VAKREVMYVGTFGLAMYLSGLTFINRKAGEKAGKALNDTLVKLKKERIKLWIFPEGTRRLTGELHQFKKGGFHAAIHAQVPIVPIVISSYESFLDVEKKVFNSGDVIVEALPQIPTTGMEAKDVEKLIEMTKYVMTRKFDELNLEISNKAK
jgi:lysophosphatidate acyltransferase